MKNREMAVKKAPATGLLKLRVTSTVKATLAAPEKAAPARFSVLPLATSASRPPAPRAAGRAGSGCGGSGCRGARGGAAGGAYAGGPYDRSAGIGSVSTGTVSTSMVVTSTAATGGAATGAPSAPAAGNDGACSCAGGENRRLGLRGRKGR
jgi:hypothetical protein